MTAFKVLGQQTVPAESVVIFGFVKLPSSREILAITRRAKSARRQHGAVDGLEMDLGQLLLVLYMQEAWETANTARRRCGRSSNVEYRPLVEFLAILDQGDADR